MFYNKLTAFIVALTTLHYKTLNPPFNEKELLNYLYCVKLEWRTVETWMNAFAIVTVTAMQAVKSEQEGNYSNLKMLLTQPK